jgi:peptidoglycan/LPS O-acetylase OafA/YrhL
MFRQPVKPEATHLAPATKQRIEILDPLRGLAALAVAWFHFTHGNKDFLQPGWLHSSGNYGWLGVEAFFVISGFIIPYSLWRGDFQLREHWKTFILKRIIRLDPPYLATIMLIIVLAYASTVAPGFRGEAPSFSFAQLTLHLGYLNALFDYDWLNPAFWTLAIEFQFYILAASVFPLVGHDRRDVRIATVVAMCGITWGYKYLGFDTRLVFAWLPLFAMGIATFWLHSNRVRWKTYLAVVGGLTAVCYQTSGLDISVVSCSTALVIALGHICNFGNSRVLTFIGTISYSFYLLHVPIGGRVINLGTRLEPTLFNQSLTLAAALLISVFASWCMYRVVERPAQRWSSALRYERSNA